MSDMGNYGRVGLSPGARIPEQNDRGVQGEQGILGKGIGMLQKVWLHMTGKAVDVHEQQLTNLRQHVSVKFGPEGLLALNENLQRKGWSGDKSTKLLSGSEISTAMQGIGDISERAQKLENQSLSEQLRNPTMREASYEYARYKHSLGQVEFLDALNHLEANRDSMTIREFNDSVSEIISKNIDERGQSFNPNSFSTDYVERNINVSSTMTDEICRLHDEYKALQQQGKTTEANKKIEEIYQRFTSDIRTEVELVWKKDNGSRVSTARGSEVERQALTSYQQAFVDVATESIQQEDLLRARRAGEFIRG